MRTFLIAALLSCFISHAQITFEKGYFIHNNGQRTECLIENLDWRNNPASFTYKLPGDEEKKTQNIMSIQEFGIDNVSKYKRFKVKIERSFNETALLTQNKQPVWKEETLFLQALVTGEANLYSYTDSNITKFFYETKTVPIEQLVRIRYIFNSQTDGENVKENNQFRQQLLNNVRCANTPENSFKNISYTENALEKHFATYNSCYDSGANSINYSEKNNNRKKFALRFTPGVYMASLSISDPGTFYNMSTDIKGIVFKIGVDFEYIFPFNKGQWSIFTNPTYQRFDAENDFTKSSTSSENGGNPIYYTAAVDYSSLEFPIGVRRYFFINQNSKIHANVAFVVDATLSSDQTIEFTNANNLPNAKQSVEISSRNCMLIGAGYSYKRFSGELRYYTPKELSSILAWSAKYTAVGLTVGYKIL